jgi:SAM-dependent methyltransferase
MRAGAVLNGHSSLTLVAIHMDIIGSIHERFVFGRRMRVLVQHLADLIPQGARVLDVGCGDGRIARLLGEYRPDIRIDGIDVLVRPSTGIPVIAFDGETIPFGDKSFDVVLFVDVLHYTENPLVFLTEARRVARQAVILKDHRCDGFFAEPILRFMDWVGNARYGVALVDNYLTEQRWRDAFREVDLTVEQWTDHLGLYPWPLSLLFERRLHLLAQLRPIRAGATDPQQSTTAFQGQASPGRCIRQ